MVLALAGRPAVPVVGVVPVMPVVEVVPVIALDSCEENDIDAPVEPVVELVAAVAVFAWGVNAVARLESSVLICATRAVTSVMLIVSLEVIDASAQELKREEASPKARLPSTVPSMDRI
jgi:hypothetical protein